MRFKQTHPFHKSKCYRLYSPTALTNAYKAVKETKVSVRRAAVLYHVPETTLRDRILGTVHPDTVKSGTAPLFTQIEEVKLVEHFKYMAQYGYGYCRQECVDIATDYAVQLGKRKVDKPLTIKWFRGFIKRWPELKVLEPRGLEHVRAKMASSDTVHTYFENLKTTLDKHGLTDKPHLIFNCDEKGISIDHKPPHIVASSRYCPSSVTSGKGQTTTLIGCVSATGVALPPFLIFPGKRFNPDLMTGASAGAKGTASESGWSNSMIFREYIETHFLQHVPRPSGQKVLLILDGHKSHVSVGLTEWADKNGIIIFILPSHTSHILQPLDVSCYGPYENIYNILCHKLMRETAIKITRYNVCELACKTYVKALCPENIQSGFKRTGIYPLNPNAVPAEYLLPAEIYTQDVDSQETVPGGFHVDKPNSPSLILKAKENKLRHVKSQKSIKQRHTMGKIVAGKELDKDTLGLMMEHEGKQKKKSDKSKQSSSSSEKAIKKPPTITEPQQGPSHIRLDVDSDSSDEVSDNEVCCVCNRLTPREVEHSISIVFIKWTQCDGFRNGYPCLHWVHLGYCTAVRVIRRGDKFLCPHCTEE